MGPRGCSEYQGPPPSVTVAIAVNLSIFASAKEWFAVGDIPPEITSDFWICKFKISHKITQRLQFCGSCYSDKTDATVVYIGTKNRRSARYDPTGKFKHLQQLIYVALQVKNILKRLCY